jgi:hypothetical protein
LISPSEIVNRITNKIVYRFGLYPPTVFRWAECCLPAT